MKVLFFSLLAMSITLGAISPLSFAAKNERMESELAKYNRKRKRTKSPGPCRVIKNACVHAGFMEDGPSGKDLKNDCQEMLLLGHTVEGVHLIPGIIASCKESSLTETKAEDSKR